MPDKKNRKKTPGLIFGTVLFSILISPFVLGSSLAFSGSLPGSLFFGLICLGLIISVPLWGIYGSRTSPGLLPSQVALIRLQEFLQSNEPHPDTKKGDIN